MKKFMFFDYQQLESVSGFVRRLEPPQKHAANPLLLADQPWECGNLQLYGSVIKAPGKPFQLWYSTIRQPFWIRLGYAESDDGISWRKPLLDLVKHEGKPTNLLLDRDIHGAAVLYDTADPDACRRYKMLAGAAPSGCVCLFASPDGIHWEQVGADPVMNTRPDSPMGLVRCRDGRYLAYHRNFNPHSGRRICRSESWTLRQWTIGEPGIVLEPDAGDPPQVQFYGMGSALYGPYEIGTLWMYHTEREESSAAEANWKMRGYQEAELTYARAANCWHRAAQGVPFIPHGRPGDWDEGNLQCASQPVFLENEIRYYYAGTNARHKVHWELEPQRAGLGLATLKPDRFVALAAGEAPAELLTQPFHLAADTLFLNAATGPDGSLRVAFLDADAKPLPGFTWEECLPIHGDATAHPVRWQGKPGHPALPVGRTVYLSVRAERARLYSICLARDHDKTVYHQF